MHRAFGSPELAPLFDPFLLLDDFGSSDQSDYLMGFPWHPHRGIETVTYLLKGTVEHEDSMGNKGTIGPGDAQWMTAGSGIFHSEMPRPLGQKGVPSNNLSSSEVRGLQLWINVPASEKMNDPEYQNLVGKAVPSAELDDGAFVKAVAGALGSVSDLGLLQGPVQDNGVDAGYFDVTIPAGGRLDLKVKEGHTAVTYVVEGEISVPSFSKPVGPKSVSLFSRSGDAVSIRAENGPTRFIVLTGKPLNEPVVWYGPIVMNGEEQLLQAFRELSEGTFVKKAALWKDLA